MSIGETLATARREAGLTLDDVANRTRIRRTVVDRIEHDDYSLCGGTVYARGHLKTIAQTVGLEPAPLLAEFDAAQGRPADSVTQPIFEAEQAAAKGPADRRGPNWSAVMLAALAVLLVLGGVQLLTGRGGGSSPAAGGGPTATPRVTPTSAPSTPSASPSPTPSSSPSDAVAQVGVLVRVAAVGGPSWVAAQGSGGASLFQGTIPKGQTKEFRDAKQVKVVIGNAGAVSLNVNGRDLGAPGSAGAVVRLTFGPGDPAVSG